VVRRTIPLLRDSFSHARNLFARLLAVILLVAFISLGVQVRGLFGEHGIAPAMRYLENAEALLGRDAFREVPTFSWLDRSETLLVTECVMGTIAAFVLLCGVLPGPCALICWALYLSLCAVGSPFLDFQWDALLLETTLLAAFALPWSLRPTWERETRVACIARLLLIWLVFRLNFESGVVKISSGDPTWRSGTALTFHFETQPLPLWTAWFAHQAPHGLLKLATWSMFGIELVAPWFLFGPRMTRLGAVAALVALQIAILATGNYAFFNLLTIALALLAVDDRVLQALLPRWRRGPAQPGNERPESIWPALCFLPFALLAFVITASGLFGTFRTGLPLPGLHAAVAPLRSFNSYGLFAVMTTKRPELIIEGSNDGRVWVPFACKWKPGDVRARPKLVAPHQPRLDWQLWFAALGTLRENGWFGNLLVRLLEGRAEVTSLLDNVPFASGPPRHVRAVLYEYHFTRFGEGAAWWKRERLGLYCPSVMLNDERTGLTLSP
jgi:hypothetical protein